jgi:DNA-binding transcriptional MerR regulator
MAFTVKQLSEMAGISVRTLHYYDEIGLLEPTWVADNGYRYYEEEAVLRLQQILFFRELDLSLNEINEIVDMPTFDRLVALQLHRDGLEAKVDRLQRLIKTIDSTILYLTGETAMSEKQLFSGFGPEEERRYEGEARRIWGDQEVGESYRRWNDYTPQQREEIKAEGGAIYRDLVAMMARGAESPETQQVIARWHQHLRAFYEPTAERLLGLSQLYVDHPDFARNFRELHPDLPEFMQQAIVYYCAHLEEQEST